MRIRGNAPVGTAAAYAGPDIKTPARFRRGTEGRLKPGGLETDARGSPHVLELPLHLAGLLLQAPGGLHEANERPAVKVGGGHARRKGRLSWTPTTNACPVKLHRVEPRFYFTRSRAASRVEIVARGGAQLSGSGALPSYEAASGGEGACQAVSCMSYRAPSRPRRAWSSSERAWRLQVMWRARAT